MEDYEESYKEVESRRDNPIKKVVGNISPTALIILGVALLIILRAFKVPLIWYIVVIMVVISLSALSKSESDELLVKDIDEAQGILHKRLREKQLSRTTEFGGMRGKIIRGNGVLNRIEERPHEWMLGWGLKDMEYGLIKWYIAKIDPWTAGITCLGKRITEFDGSESSNIRWLIPGRYRKQIEFERGMKEEYFK